MEKGGEREPPPSSAHIGIQLWTSLPFLLDAFIPCCQTKSEFFFKKVPGTGVRIRN